MKHQARHGQPNQQPNQQPHHQQDHIYNHGASTISLCLLLRDLDDAVREGDGERICRGWKFLLPLFKENGHTKYAYAALLLEAKLKIFLTPRKAEQLSWNRTVNDVGGRGKRKSRDLKVEQLNHIAKEEMRGIGLQNLNPETVRRIGRSIRRKSELVQSLDADFSVIKRTRSRQVKQSKKDFEAMVHAIAFRAKVYDIQLGREYPSFPKFDKNLLYKLDGVKLHTWITKHVKRWADVYES